MIGSLLTDSAASRSSRINIDSSLGEEEQEIGIDGTAAAPPSAGADRLIPARWIPQQSSISQRYSNQICIPPSHYE